VDGLNPPRLPQRLAKFPSQGRFKTGKAPTRACRFGSRIVDRSKNIFRVDGSCSPRGAVCPGESIVVTNAPFAGDFLLNGFPERICALGSFGYNNLIKSVMNIARRYQISHGRLQRFVPHPMLNRSHIEAGTEHAGAYVERNVFRSNFRSSNQRALQPLCI
jgi:hypothetical protein